MRKLFPMLLFTLLLALLMAVPALAADFTYDDFSATLTVPDSYTMLTTLLTTRICWRSRD